MRDEKELKIFYHLGMGKVASTFLQYQFFPFLQNVKYIQRTKHQEYAQIIEKDPHGSYVLSRENDRQLEREVQKFAKHFTDVRAILIFRRHDSWLASQYRRFLKNGVNVSFEQFIDLDENQGYWYVKELDFFSKIQIIEKYFNHKPLVLFYDELQEDNKDLFNRLAHYCGAKFDYDSLNLKSKHKSYEEKQLKFMKAFSSKFNIPQDYSKNKLVAAAQRWLRMMVKYPVLYMGRVSPGSFTSDEPLIDPDQCIRIREHGKKDWERLKAYAAENNPKFTSA